VWPESFSGADSGVDGTDAAYSCVEAESSFIEVVYSGAEAEATASLIISKPPILSF
jgi:hypothetical protein